MNLKALAIAACALVGTAASASAQDSVAKDSPEVTDSLSRAAGTALGSMVRGSLEQLQGLGVTIDGDIFNKAFIATLNGEDTGFTAVTANMYIQQYLDAKNSFDPVAEQAFVDAVAKEEGATMTPQGIAFQIITEGEGVMPADGDKVAVKYVGRLSDGTVFDETDDPITFDVTGVVEGFKEGLKMMKNGGTYRIVFPASMGYGEKGIGGVIPGNAALDFTVTLVSINPE